MDRKFFIAVLLIGAAASSGIPVVSSSQFPRVSPVALPGVSQPVIRGISIPVIPAGLLGGVGPRYLSPAVGNVFDGVDNLGLAYNNYDLDDGRLLGLGVDLGYGLGGLGLGGLRYGVRPLGVRR